MVTSERAEDHEDFVTTHGDALRSLALALCGDAHTADQLVDATLGDLWRQRDRVLGTERAGWARDRLAHRWADLGVWGPAGERELDTMEQQFVTRAIIESGDERFRRRALIGGTAVAVGAAATALWRHGADGGMPVVVDRLPLRLRQTSDERGERWLQVWFPERRQQERLLTELATPLETPTTVVVPLVGGLFQLFDGARLVVTWAKGAWQRLDVLDGDSYGVHPATLRRLALGLDEVTVGFAVYDGGDQPPLVVRHDGRSFRADQTQVITGFVDTPEGGVAGYVVGPTGSIVLVSPVARQVDPTGLGGLGVQRADLGDGREFLAVPTLGRQHLSVVRRGVDLGGAVVAGGGERLLVVCRPLISPAHPVEVRWIDPDGVPRSQEIT
ncbi:hypothetical protein ACSDQ9_00370 [Aestuariimicrobium soli]|uniref:hypothetical protein n=1 Tax=Aestuariimicrobium soli TaxID=2035834 RepID=UPI003EBB1DC2